MMTTLVLSRMPPTVHLPVLADMHELEIFEPVIVFDSVDVVDVLPPLQQSAKRLLHDDAVLKDVTLHPLSNRMVRLENEAVPACVVRESLAPVATPLVVAGDEIQGATLTNGSQSTATATARLRRFVRHLVLVASEIPHVVVSSVQRVGDGLTASTSAWLRRGVMAPKEVGRSIAKELPSRDELSATTTTRHVFHVPHVTTSQVGKESL